jgi:hypothetical protein
MDLLINISEIAIITGDNTFKSKRDYLIDFWKKNLKADFEKYKKLTEFVKETDEDVIKKITSKNNIDISLELKQCVKSNNTNDLSTMKAEIFKKMTNLTEVERTEITRSITNTTNTKFGIKNENDITKLYENMSGQKIIKDDKYRKIKLFDVGDLHIYIGGKIDGINANGDTIIEVKNRIHKLFYVLRDYEKVQIMCYMHLFGVDHGHLVEAHKKKENTDINIIDVDLDETYMDSIFSKITDFALFFNNFILDHDAKINILKNNCEIDF